MIKRITILGILLSIVTNVWANKIGTIIIDSLPISGVNLLEYLEYYEEETNSSLTIDSIVDNPSFLFEHLTKDSIYPGMRKVWWLRFKAYNPTNRSIRNILIHQRTGYTKLYIRKGASWIDKNIGEFTLPKDRKGFLTKQYALIDFPPKDTSEIFIRLEVHNSYNKPLGFTLHQEGEGLQKVLKLTDDRTPYFVQYGAFLGISLCFGVFALMQFFQYKDKVYLFYSAYVISLFIAYICRGAKHFYTFFTPYVEDWYAIVNAPLLYLNGIAYLFFLKSFLSKTNNKEAYLGKIIYFFTVVIFLFLVADLILKAFNYYPESYVLYYVGRGVLFVVFLYIIWFSLKFPFSAFHYLVIGSLILVFFGFISILNDGWLDNPLTGFLIKKKFWKLSLSAMQVAMIVEILFFSLALGYKTKLIIEEGNQVRDLVILTQQENETLRSQLLDSTSTSKTTNNKENTDKLPVPTRKGYDLLESKQILYCKAEGNMCCIFLENGKKIMVSQTLKNVISQLSEIDFYRIHNSYLINLNYVSSYSKGIGGSVILNDKVELSVSKAKKADLLKKLGLD